MSVGDKATLVHGITMETVDRLSRVCASKLRSTAIDHQEAREEAWHGIVKLLYSTTERPVKDSMFRAGMDAINTRVTAELRHHGYRLTPDGVVGGSERPARPDRPDINRAPRFVSYWMPRVGVSGYDWTERIVEAMTLPHVLAVLTPEQYQAISTLAAFDNDAGAAADALGLKYHGFMYRVYSGRKKAVAAWFDTETPGGLKQPGTCGAGHARNRFGRRLSDGRWECKVCKRNSARRQAARGPQGGDRWHDELDVHESESLKFAPAPADNADPVGLRSGTVIGSTACWCGLNVGHDWPHKEEGAPHPRAA